MIRKTITIALFTFLGLLGTGVVFLASYENELNRLLRLRQEGQSTLAERKVKAKEIAAKVLRRYEATDHLSFRAESVYYWCKEDDWQTRLPMEWWLQSRGASVEVAMTPQSLRTHIRVQGRPLYTFLMNGGTFYEFKWPWNGIPGQRTEYPADRKGTRLCSGVDGWLLCNIGLYRGTWAGKDAHRPGRFKQFCENGAWLGAVSEGGQSCDLILNERDDLSLLEEEDRRWDAFYVSQDGLVVRWDIIHRRQKDWYWFVQTDRYFNFSTAPLSAEIFTPDEELMKEAKDWQVLSDAESWALLQTELRGPTTAPSGE